VTRLELCDVSAGYGAGRVLHGIDVEVADRGITALLGANGAGKTTTLRAISGMVRRSGSISFAGRDLRGLSTDRIARLGVAHVPQGGGTLTHLSVRDNLGVGAVRRRQRGGDRRGHPALPGPVPRPRGAVGRRRGDAVGAASSRCSPSGAR
jgi:branched-chain amino acid transport system ATP-binding protein